MPIELRQYQQNAIYELKKAFVDAKKKNSAKAPRIVFQLPTGAGKTLISYHMISSALRKGNRSTFIAPRISLIDQTAERFIEYGMNPSDIGIMQSSHPWYRPEAPVQICMWQTLARRGVPISDLIIQDESHLRFKSFSDYINSEACRNIPVIGLSATPWSKGMGKDFDTLISPIKMQELIDLGYLSKFRIFTPNNPDLSKVKIASNGELDEQGHEEAMSQGALVGDIVNYWLKYGDNEPTLCFCVNKAHAQVITERFQKEGVGVAYVDDQTTREERKEINSRLSSGIISVVVSIGTMTEGVDLDIRVVILARYIRKSKKLYVQIVGRMLRPAEGKQWGRLFDHSGTTCGTSKDKGMGLVTDIHYDFLDDGTVKSKERREAEDAKIKLPRECMSCGCLIPAGIKACIACGAENKPKCGVDVIEGDLVEFTGKLDKSKGPKKEKKKEYTMAEKQAFYSGLRYLANDRGKNDSWVLANYREKFGTWPKGLNNVSCFPSAEVRSWDNHKRIAWSKRKQNAGAQHAR